MINAGDGTGEHPTQALLDLFTIREELGTLDGLHVAMVGDLRFGRTVHSLTQLLSRHNVRFTFVSPEALRLPLDYMNQVKDSGKQVRETYNVADVIGTADVLYVTRVQKERFSDLSQYEALKDFYRITPDLMQQAKDHAVIMHPLPRVNEIDVRIDADPRAAYFRQVRNGMYVRMALLAMVFRACVRLHNEVRPQNTNLHGIIRAEGFPSRPTHTKAGHGRVMKDNHMRFFDRLEQASDRNQSLLCIGLDPDMKRLPEWVLDDPDPIFAFNRHIIDLTCDLVCAYKPNIAFYEALGEQGMQALRSTIAYIKQCDVPIILDCKRSDIGSSAEKYAQALFEDLQADAITVVPYMGWDSVEPFLRYRDRGVFVLTLSSNPGAQDFQCLDGSGHALFERVAEQAVGWNDRQNVGLVVGATHPNEICCVRAIAQEEWFLMPGIGSQGGDLEIALTNSLRPDGKGVIVNASRAIIFADDPREATMAMREEIERARALRRSGVEGCASPRRTQSDDPNLVDLATGMYDIGAIQFGDFILTSGVQSPFYIDLRLLVTNPTLLMQAARALFHHPR